MNKKLSFVFLIFFVLLAVVPSAVQAIDMETSTDLEIQATTIPEMNASLSQSFTFPVLQGNSPLTEGNNLVATVSADISPVYIAINGELDLTPIAFLIVSAGAQLGTGWNMALGNGIGIVTKGDNDSFGRPEMNIEGSAFSGLYWQAWGAATFQFDLAAIFPGDWNHIVVQSRQEFRFSGFSEAGPNDYWIFLNDDGENRNGLNYHASYTLGYMMPSSPVLNFVGLQAEIHKPLYRTEAEEIWGGDLGNWLISAVFNFSISPKLNSLLAFQLWTRRNHGNPDLANRYLYYQDMPLSEIGGNRQVLFHRAAIILSYNLR